ICFLEYYEIKFCEANAEIKTEKHFNSLTSIVIIPKECLYSYYLDSEKTPFFQNKEEAFYKQEAIGSIINTDKEVFPLIPTLTFKQNENLWKIESLLAKKRIKNADASRERNTESKINDTQRYITPQGFLRDSTILDFIKPSNEKEENDDSKFQFKVSGVTLSSDFNLSVSKEDVFFILTSALLKNGNQPTVKINFKIGDSDFKVELGEFNSMDNNDTYIIFKFSRFSFERSEE